jgi:very-short-patch-repair endonuclease
MKEGRYFLPYNPQLVEQARKMRKNLTFAEQKLWQFFRSTPPFCRGGGVKVWRQKAIAHFVVDFYCPKLKLVIEVDGASHFTPEGMEYDQARTKILEGYGLTVIRFTNDEVINHFEGVCKQIEGFIKGKSPPD